MSIDYRAFPAMQLLFWLSRERYFEFYSTIAYFSLTVNNFIVSKITEKTYMSVKLSEL